MRARGTCHVLMAFDVGFEIDLDKAEARLAAERSDAFKHKRAAPDEPGRARLPLRLTREVEPLALAAHRTDERLEIAIYGFGAVCLTYTLPLDQDVAQLVRTSTELYENAALLADARTRAREILGALGDAVREPFLAEEVEDYVIYGLRAPEDPDELARLEREQGELLARILRAEEGHLSAGEVENALDGRISYGPDELVLVDWFGALLFGNEMADERRVLELATVELVELRFLDDRLERRIDAAYGLLTGARRPLYGLFSPRTREVERLARFQADSAILHENSDNALKLLGDDYLARLYDVCSDRFHFSAWDLAIERKLATLESIYSKISDLAARRRAELLEWIIIALFVLDIALYLLDLHQD
jgi:hypothetical protein